MPALTFSLKSALAAALLLGLLGCQTPRERVILLPKADGSPSGVVTVQSKTGASLRLDQSYAQVDAGTAGELKPGQSNAETVQKEYGSLLAMQPAKPRSFVVNFSSNSNELTVETAPIVALVREALTALQGGELVVIGHTDRVGSLEANDKLSLVRAETVRELLVRQGIPREKITVVGRGEREPLVATADEVAEARNRRVEIKLR
ncbi:outer membrane protein OmpA-like peptidoglycan-associated protein [Paucibacter oligotrophus]|uniref:Outer membrane protein OmpA-like peptidoglycan-associated protein n=1 Tax=Roseateles oligotrophus TaxID=1769250 RepID=A0A840LEY0_9BURK|nr:OmpA family protein [Roseateles oligotrophus]MBB4844609.1 outer membrane protein OmpA-like peptidoglycan-associated protein [Roseateles oligotrophus]